MKKYNLFYLFFAFFLIYYPPLISVNTVHLIGGVSWFLLFLNWPNVKKNINLTQLLKFLSLFVALFILIITTTTLNGNSLSSVAFLLFWFIDIFPGCLLLANHFRKKKYTIYDILTFLLIVASFQGLLAILAYLNPAIQEYFISKLVTFGFSDVFEKLAAFRMYGFSSNLTFATPIVQSFMGVVAIYLALNKKWCFILFSPLLLFSGIINARTSVVVMMIGIVCIIVTLNILNKRKFFNFVLISMILLLVVSLFINIMNVNSNPLWEWVTAGYDEIILFIKGENSGYFTYITNPNKYVMPSGIALIFGVGVRIMIYSTKYELSSDVGYINDIWLGGLIYAVAILFLFISFCFNLLKNNELNEVTVFKFLGSFFIMVFLVINLKGYIFNINDFTTLFFIIYFHKSIIKNNLLIEKRED